MRLRRIIEHLGAQHWTAVWIDLVIVVVGVFIGIQVSNWNQARADRQREHLLLVDLRAEMAESIRQTGIRQRAFAQIARSGTRALGFLDAGQSCGEQCWPVIVDFFHASQWQSMPVGLPTYDEMRRNGWPRQRRIVDAVEAYLRQSRQIAVPLQQPPAYRARVRGLIPLPIHEPYWTTCFQLTNGEESYVQDCPQAVTPSISAAGVAAIVKDAEIHRSLTEWTGFTQGFYRTLEGQNDASKQALVLIDAELAKED
jgi:hypothetical protein